MDEFSSLFGDEFFLFDSNNLASVEQEFYGYTIQNNELIQREDIDNNSELDGVGAYIWIEVDDENIKISQDYCGSYGLYLYEHDDYFAISNSFVMLVEYLKNMDKPISFNKEYADAFLFTHLFSFAYDKTLVNEITFIPRDFKVLINKIDKVITYETINYEERCISIDSEEGIEVIDQWYSKWVDTLRSLKLKTNNIEVDLSGGKDSRVAAVIWLTANIDLNKITINSHPYSIQDFEIANEIADEFNFKLNSRNNLNTNIIPFEEFNTVFNISNYLKFGSHKEWYFKPGRYDETLYNYGGTSGECIRGYYEYTPAEYKNVLIGYIKNFTDEMIPAADSVLDKSMDKLRSKFNMYDDTSYDLVERMYIETYHRIHGGKDLVGNYFINKIKLAPLMDLHLQKLKLRTDECDDGDLLIALIFQRYCPDLLKFRFNDGHIINDSTLIYAKKLNEKYPLISQPKNYISGPEIVENNVQSTPLIIQPAMVRDLLQDVVYSRTFEMEFKKYYSSKVYQAILDYVENGTHHPLRHVYSALSILKIIHDTQYKQINTSGTHLDWLESFRNGEQVVDVPLEFFNLLMKYATARIDIKNHGNQDNSIEIMHNSDSCSVVSFPRWFKSDDGLGAVIQSTNGQIDLKVKCIHDGIFRIYLRSLNVQDKNNKKFPIYIDYTNLSVNGEEIINDNTLVWHDDKFVFEKQVSDSEILDIHIEWMPFNNLSTFND